MDASTGWATGIGLVATTSVMTTLSFVRVIKPDPIPFIYLAVLTIVMIITVRRRVLYYE